MKVERKKLILIVAAVATTLLLVLAIVISALTAPANNNPDLPEKPNPTSTRDPQINAETTEQGSEVIVDKEDAKEGDTPPEGLYDNFYDNDEGYKPLPETFNPDVNPTKDTVYDPEYVYNTMNRLMCELSNKNTSTSKALQPLEDFSEDLRTSTADNALSTLNQIEYDLKWFEDNIGERIPGDTKDSLRISYCDAGNVGDVE